MTDQEKKDALNEAVILKSLDHPNIIKFKEVFIQRKPVESLNIVTEYADGGDLEQKIKEQENKPFTEVEILDYFIQICLALRHVHNKKIIHRNLRSSNIFLMKSGLVKLGGFGVAKILKSSTVKDNEMVRNDFYLSPEILLNKPYDIKSDIWALGVLLYELLTFKMPFDSKSLPLLWVKVSKGVYDPPSSKYSSEIRDLLKKCLTLDPSKRPSIDDILNLPLIKNRIKNFLNEVQYDPDFSKNVIKKNENQKKEDEKHHQEKMSEQFKKEDNEINKIKKDVEKEIGNDLLKEVLGIMEKTCDKNAINLDKELIKKNILELTSKGFDKTKVEKAVDKIDEIIRILKHQYLK